MERLTEKHFNGEGYYMKCSGEYGCIEDCGVCVKLDKLVDHLAAYEDSGLTPEQIANQTANLDFLLDKNAGSINADRLRELVKADAEGRLEILPCAVDATAYYADMDIGRVLVGYVADYEFLRGGNRYFNFYNVDSDVEWVSVELPIEEFGKTVFLTREEAEVALKGGADE